VVHLVGVSAWLGGLALLVVAVLRPAGGGGADDGEGAGAEVATLDRVVGRYSSLAFGAVVLIVVSGVVQSWRQLGSPGALVDTDYGRLLIAKVALFALMLAGAGVSRRWVRARVAAPAPASAAGPAPALSPGPGATAAGRHPDLAGLRRSVAAEALVAVAVLAVTAGLVQAVPGETARRAGEGAGAAEAFTTEMHGNEVLVEATVDPAATGPVTVEVLTLDHGGTPIDPEEVTATLTLPAEGLGPLAVGLEEEGTGAFRSAPTELPFAGEWDLVVTVRTSDIDSDRLSATFTVR
jgi:copper transport protein